MASMNEDKDETRALRDHFRPSDGTAMATEIQLKETLGQGHFGRVRLIESAHARDYLAKPDIGIQHSGLFALKIMKKSEILRLKQEQHVHDERRLLLRLKNPFIVTPYHTYQDDRNIFMVMEYIPGGEIGTKLRRDETFSNELARFYIAQLVMVLEYMHAEHVIYRGVGTDNLMLDAQGYIKLVDFGFAKHLPPKEDDENSTKTYTLCGTPEYLAPEIVKNEGHGKGADWWATGVLIYEMLAGYPPWYSADPFEIYSKILKGEVKTPKMTDSMADQLIRKLLAQDVPKRLGCSAGGAEEIKRHKWFRGLDWAALYNKTLEADFKPEIGDEYDTSNFTKYDDSVEESGPLLCKELAEKFDYWQSYPEPRA